MDQAFGSRSSFAPRDEIAAVVASVSSHESGFIILVTPRDKSPAKSALWVWALEGGAHISPIRTLFGVTVAFNFSSSRIERSGS